MQLKKVSKIILGLILFLTLPSLLLFGALYLKYNEPTPTFKQPEAATQLAHKMLEALNYQAYQNTHYIEWTFKKRRHYKWHKNKGLCTVQWQDYKVELDFNTPDKSVAFVHNFKVFDKKSSALITKALTYFKDDSFWLIAPYKVLDEGVKRGVVTLKNGNQGLLVNHAPQRTFLWLLDNNYRPYAFKMWTDLLPIDGIEMSWSDWTTTQSGALLPNFHKFLVFGLPIDHLKTK